MCDYFTIGVFSSIVLNLVDLRSVQMKLTTKEIEDIMIQYYSPFTCFDFKKLNSGIALICDVKRNDELKGYSGKFTIYALFKDHKCIVAYSSKYKDFFIINLALKQFGWVKSHLLLSEIS